MVNLDRDKKNHRRKPGKDGKILSDHRQDGHVAVGGIGNLAHTRVLQCCTEGAISRRRDTN